MQSERPHHCGVGMRVFKRGFTRNSGSFLFNTEHYVRYVAFAAMISRTLAHCAAQPHSANIHPVIAIGVHLPARPI
ncbi:hypothetical protein KC8_08295 [Sphingomonas sp. KC8]|nr:hypothetical protein KC8_08295 [Sphingomonas sp. KC8]